MDKKQSILMIVTSCDKIAPGMPTGLWLEEFAIPYMEFSKHGFNINVASIKGGKAPIDPRSNPTNEQQESWNEALASLNDTTPITLIDPKNFKAAYFPGGHGTMFDFPTNKDLHNLLLEFFEQDKVIAAMCHGPAALSGVTLNNGTPLVSGKTITSFTNEEEAAAGMTQIMPFLLESRLRDLGAKFIAKPNWTDHVQVDGKLITGQNPQSSKSTARAVIDIIGKA